MATLLKLGPADRGRPLSAEEFDNAIYQHGYEYELIDGRLSVSPLPNLPAHLLERWVRRKLETYAEEHPERINYIDRARVFVEERPEATRPEPDVAAYRDFPLDRPIAELRWQDVSPILVAEVLSEDDPNKDLVRNVELYLQVPTIREYWIIDGRQNPDEPAMIVHRRRGRRWLKPIEVGFGETYTTPLLPGFTLVVDPHA
jgi:Uma2 family endonuclease